MKSLLVLSLLCCSLVYIGCPSTQPPASSTARAHLAGDYDVQGESERFDDHITTTNSSVGYRGTEYNASYNDAVCTGTSTYSFGGVVYQHRLVFTMTSDNTFSLVQQFIENGLTKSTKNYTGTRK